MIKYDIIFMLLNHNIESCLPRIAFLSLYWSPIEIEYSYIEAA